MTAPDLAALANSTEYSRRHLTVSTGHVSKATHDALELYTDPLFGMVGYSKTDFGWVVFAAGVEPAVLERMQAGEHADLAALIKLTQDIGYDRLELDRDAPELPEHLGFATFDW